MPICAKMAVLCMGTRRHCRHRREALFLSKHERLTHNHISRSTMQNTCLDANMSADGHAVETGNVRVNPPNTAYS